jgi:hypothetical protein
MYKGYAMAAAPNPWSLVDEASALSRQVSKSLVNIDDRKGDVVQPIAVACEELAHSRFFCERLKQLDVGTTDRDHRLAYPLVLYRFNGYRADVVLAVVVLERGIEIVHGNGDVMDVVHEHGNKSKQDTVHSSRKSPPAVGCSLERDCLLNRFECFWWNAKVSGSCSNAEGALSLAVIIRATRRDHAQVVSEIGEM